MPGTRFIKSVFIEQATNRYNALIAEQQSIVAVEEATTDTEKIDRWREEQSLRVQLFANRLKRGEVTDHELASFETKRVPDVGRVNWSSETFAKRQMKQLQHDLNKILVYARSLAEVEPGVVEVSAADLKRIGYGL